MSRGRAAWLLLLAGATARAGPLTVAGSAGLGVEHSDRASPNEARGIPGWEWNGNLSFAWAPLNPRLLTLRGGGEYGSSRWVNGPLEESDRWTYDASAAVLPGAPLSLQLGASRNWSGSRGPHGLVGESLVSSETASASLTLRGYPRLHASFTRTDLENESLGGGRRRLGSRRLAVGSSHSTPGLAYSIDYGGSWNDSAAVVESNYRYHGLNVAGFAKLSDLSEFRFNQSYTLREPTVTDSRNPRLDQNVLGTGVGLRPGPRTQLALDYGFQHALVEAPGFEVETTSHAGILGGTHRWAEEWTGDATFQLTHAEARNGGVSRVADGQTLSAGASWRRQHGPRLRTGVTGRASAGAVEQAGRTDASWGVEGGGTATWDAPYGSGTASYGGSWRVNDATFTGREWVHRLRLEGRGDRWGHQLSLSLQATASRRSDELLGASGSRSLVVTAEARARRYGATFTAGATEGITERLGFEISPGLYVLPYELDARSLHATLALHGSSGRLSGSLRLGTARVDTTTEPLEYSHSAELVAGYAIGRIRLQLSDRFVMGGRGDSWSRANVFLATLSRNFSLAL